MNHQLDFALPQNRASLTAVADHCNHSIRRGGVLEPQEGVDGVEVACHWLEDGIVPRGPIVDDPLLLLKTHRVCVERAVPVEAGLQVERDFLSDPIVDRDTVEL